MGAIWPWVTAWIRVRWPRAGVSGPRKAVQVYLESGIFLTVAYPFVRGLSASVVGQENEGGVGAILRQRL